MTIHPIVTTKGIQMRNHKKILLTFLVLAIGLLMLTLVAMETRIDGEGEGDVVSR